MKNNSFIIPSIKFYVVKLTKDIENKILENILSDKELEINFMQEGAMLIPFKNVDGLSVKDIANILEVEKFFAIVAISKINAKYDVNRNEEEGYLYNQKSKYSSSKILFSLIQQVVNVQQEVITDTIDNIMEKYILRTYEDVSVNTQRIYKHFLEKYKCSSYDAVINLIKK